MNHLTSSIRSLALYLSVKIIIYSLFVLPILFMPMISHADVIFVWHPVDGSLSSGILTIDAPVSGGFSVPPTAVTSYEFSFGPGLTVNLNNAQPLIASASIVSFGGSSLDGGVFDLRLLEDPSILVFNTFLDSGTDVSQYDPSSQNIVVRGNWLRAGVETPLMISISAIPETLWPPNGKMVPVTISGAITDAGAGVNASTATYAVTDEYGSVQPSGSVTLGSNGSYTFTISLQASRHGIDKDGRQYTIIVSAQDNVGNSGSASTVVTVSHD